MATAKKVAISKVAARGKVAVGSSLMFGKSKVAVPKAAKAPVKKKSAASEYPVRVCELRTLLGDARPPMKIGAQVRCFMHNGQSSLRIVSKNGETTRLKHPHYAEYTSWRDVDFVVVDRNKASLVV